MFTTTGTPLSFASRAVTFSSISWLA